MFDDADGSRDGDGPRVSFREAHPTEQAVGIGFYVSDVEGTGGRLRRTPEAFRVRELERIDPEPIDADPGAYPHVVLRAILRSWETNDFARTLSDRLGISRQRVRWAGTKDKRAITTQLFSIDGVDPSDVPGAAQGPPPIDEAEIEVLGRLGRSIELGDLAGNAFEITIAEPDRPEQVAPVTASLAAFLEDDGSEAPRLDAGLLAEGTLVGVPNFFGQQRFGSRRPITHEVGLAIVRGDWEGAVRTYVADAYESEPESTQDARAETGDCFDNRDWTGALDAMPDRLGYERTLLHALDRQSTDAGGGATAAPDFQAALDDLPENLQRMFVHAAQSVAFNRMLSERLAAGLPFNQPVAGDVVCFADTDAPADLVLPDTDRLQRVTDDRVETIARHCERGRAFVTAPLVGTDTELGHGEPGEIERRVLDDMELSPGAFDLPDPYGSTGTRRALLLRTDLEVRSAEGGASDAAADPTLSFALPKGAYATVLLREYLKVDPAEMA